MLSVGDKLPAFTLSVQQGTSSLPGGGSTLALPGGGAGAGLGFGALAALAGLAGATAVLAELAGLSTAMGPSGARGTAHTVGARHARRNGRARVRARTGNIGPLPRFPFPALPR